MARRLWNLPCLRNRSEAERGGIVAVAVAIALGLITLENFVGALTGLGMCGLLGIGIIFVLAVDGPPFNWFQELGLACSAMSLFCLGAMVSALPLVSYDAARARHENPEE